MLNKLGKLGMEVTDGTTKVNLQKAFNRIQEILKSLDGMESMSEGDLKSFSQKHQPEFAQFKKEFNL